VAVEEAEEVVVVEVLETVLVLRVEDFELELEDFVLVELELELPPGAT
jgi:hypothetical protein